MSVNVTFVGRLGNNMFQYAIGRIIAEHHRFALCCTPTSASFTALFPSATLRLSGKQYFYPEQTFSLGDSERWNGHKFDLQSVLLDRSHRRISLHGYFQRYEYFAPHRAEIREWFVPSRAVTDPGIRSNDVLVNIRRGIDYALLNWTLPMSYYERLLGQMHNIDRVFVCGTHIDDHTRRYLAKYDPVYYHGTPADHFVFFGRFRRIILSNSTFAWWASFLSNALEIYAPVNTSGNFYSFRDGSGVDLNTHEDRYKEIDIDRTDMITFSVRDTYVPSAITNRLRQVDGDTERVPNRTINEASFLIWLLRQNTLLTVRDMRSHYDGTNFASFLHRLLHSGILQINNTYIEG